MSAASEWAARVDQLRAVYQDRPQQQFELKGSNQTMTSFVDEQGDMALSVGNQTIRLTVANALALRLFIHNTFSENPGN